MVGALLVLVGMTAVLLGGLLRLIEMDTVSTSIATRTSGETSLLLPIGIALTLAGGVVLLLSPGRRIAS